MCVPPTMHQRHIGNGYQLCALQLNLIALTELIQFYGNYNQYTAITIKFYFCNFTIDQSYVQQRLDLCADVIKLYMCKTSG